MYTCTLNQTSSKCSPSIMHLLEISIFICLAIKVINFHLKFQIIKNDALTLMYGCDPRA